MFYPTFQWYITKIQIYKKVLKYESLEAYLAHSSSLGPYHATLVSFWNQEIVQAVRMHTIMSKFKEYKAYKPSRPKDLSTDVWHKFWKKTPLEGWLFHNSLLSSPEAIPGAWVYDNSHLQTAVPFWLLLAAQILSHIFSGLHISSVWQKRKLNPWFQTNRRPVSSGYSNNRTWAVSTPSFSWSFPASLSCFSTKSNNTQSY